MEHARNRPAGLRKVDALAAATAHLASRFVGSTNANPSQYLAAFKRAAPYLHIPRSIVGLVDVLFAWTQKQDWMPGQQPVVWPRNETLALKLSISIRQLQHLLACACRMQLIGHKDSPNGHRGGARTSDGNIKWGYGILLSPIAVRYEEFLAVAAEGARIEQEITIARKRISAARRRIASIALSPLDPNISALATKELELARIAVQHLRYCRDLTALTNAADQLEERTETLLNAMMEHVNPPSNTSDIAPSDAMHCTHSTTTNQHQSAKAEYSNGFAKRSSGAGYDVRQQGPQTPAEEDLERYGITPAFLESAAPDICTSLAFQDIQWGDVIVLAERLASRYTINTQTWREACRLMGQKAAAAAVIATVQKFRAGTVERPGAYLRGMSKRAANGELHLGRTFHGLKEMTASAAAASMRNGDDPRSLGQIARAAVQRAAIHRSRTASAT